MVVLKQGTEINSGCRFKFVYHRRGKKTEPVKDVIGSVTSSCYLSKVTQRMQSKRKRKSTDKEVLCKPKERLDSGVFDDYLE